MLSNRNTESSNLYNACKMHGKVNNYKGGYQNVSCISFMCVLQNVLSFWEEHLYI